jgi:hypothetical protein
LKAYEQIKQDKMDEVVGLLEKFKGELSLSDVLNQDIPLLSELSKAKDRLNIEINKERER